MATGVFRVGVELALKMLYIMVMNLNLETSRIVFPLNITFSRRTFHYTGEHLVPNLTYMHRAFKFFFKFKSMYVDYMLKLHYLKH